VEEGNHKGVEPALLPTAGHCRFLPIDVNLAKQLNILLGTSVLRQQDRH